MCWHEDQKDIWEMLVDVRTKHFACVDRIAIEKQDRFLVRVKLKLRVCIDGFPNVRL
jgi:hypothetical protein